VVKEASIQSIDLYSLMLLWRPIVQPQKSVV
jgi:hypothetical protein